MENTTDQLLVEILDTLKSIESLLVAQQMSKTSTTMHGFN